MQTHVAVVILTFNEEANLTQALTSVCGWAREVIIVDSFSTDRTLDICRSFGCRVFQHRFENYSKQRNWALDELSVGSGWILFLDADEWLPDALKSEIDVRLASEPAEDGFLLKRRFYWSGSWIRRGYYPIWLLRLFRRGEGRCEEREINEHIIVRGAVGRLGSDFIHEDRKPLFSWIEKHNRYAHSEAAELFKEIGEQQSVQPRFFGDVTERSRWLRYKVYNRLPPILRSVMYFVYCYFLRCGFLDGRAALVYHFLHAFWYPLLIDLNYLEMRQQSRYNQASVERDAVGSIPE